MKQVSPCVTSCIALAFSAIALQAQLSEEDLRLDYRESLAREQFSKGDFSPIDEAWKSHDLALLWHIFRSASRATKQRAEVWDETEARVRRALMSHPDHASFLGDQLEVFSSDHTKSHLRERYFRLLGAFGGPDAIAQLGRFILDERNPLPPWVVLGKTIGSLPCSNSDWAVEAMNEALGEESPWKPYRNQNGHVFHRAGGPPIDDIMKQWWIETGSKKYGMGIPPAIHPAPKPEVIPPPPPPPPEAPSAPPEWSWELPAISALVLLSALLVVLRKSHFLTRRRAMAVRPIINRRGREGSGT